MIASITIKWFLELPGIFITAGVVLILISIVVYAVSGAKAKKLVEDANKIESEPVVNSTTQNVVNTPSNGLDNNSINSVNTVDANSAVNPNPVNNNLQEPVPVTNTVISPEVGHLNLNSADYANTTVPTNPVEPTNVVEPVNIVQPTVSVEPVNVDIIPTVNPVSTSENVNVGAEIPTIEPIPVVTPVVDTVSPIPEITPIPEVSINNNIPTGGNEIDGTTVIQPVDATVKNDSEEII